MRSLKQIFSNQKGMSLVEVVVAAALAILVSIGVMKIQQTTTKSSIKATSDFEYNSLRNYIKSTIANGGNCTQTFKENGYEYDSDYQTSTTDTFTLVKSTTYDETTDTYSIDNKDEIPVGDESAPIPGFNNWAMMEVGIEALRDQVVGTDGTIRGVCLMEFTIKRVERLTSKNTFGAPDKKFKIETSCHLNKDGDEFKYCIENEATTVGFWRLIDTGVLTSGIEYAHDIHVGGFITTDQAVVVQSDERIKKEFEEIPRASESLEEISGYYYFMRHEEFPNKNYSDKRQIGVIAQEIEKIYPEAVIEGSDGIKAVNYQMLVPVLIQAHKEQEEKIKEQQRRLDNLEKKLNKLLN